MEIVIVGALEECTWPACAPVEFAALKWVLPCKSIAAQNARGVPIRFDLGKEIQLVPGRGFSNGDMDILVGPSLSVPERVGLIVRRNCFQKSSRSSRPLIIRCRVYV